MNADAEMSLLGCVMYDGASLDVVGDLSPAHFGEPLHETLFSVVRELQAEGRAPLPEVIAGRAGGRVTMAPGENLFRLLMAMVEQAPPPANIKEYADEIMAQSLRRDLYRFGDKVASLASKGAEPPDVLLQEAEKALLGMRLDTGKARLIGAAEAVDRVLRDLDSPPAARHGILTGLRPLDEHLGPWLPGDLIVLAGRPAMGKSAQAGVISDNVACPGLDDYIAGRTSGLGPLYGVIEVHFEMSVDQATRRRLTEVAQRIAQTAAPTYSKLRRRTVTIEQRELLGRAGEIIKLLPIKAVRLNGASLAEVRSIVRRQRAEWAKEGIPLVLATIDHVGLIKAEGSSRYQQQTDIAIDAKAMFGELEIPGLALAQLSRRVEDRDNKRPTLPDLRDSGAWEENADIVIGAYRDAYYAEQEPEPTGKGPKGTLEWASWDERKRSKVVENLLLKVREGQRGTVRLWGDMGTNAIRAEAPGDSFFDEGEYR